MAIRNVVKVVKALAAVGFASIERHRSPGPGIGGSTTPTALRQAVAQVDPDTSKDRFVTANDLLPSAENDTNDEQYDQVGSVALTNVIGPRRRRGRMSVDLHDAEAVSRSTDLNDVVNALRLTDREWLVLTARLGPSPQVSLQDLGDLLGVTRERVRQIQLKAIEVVFSRKTVLRSVVRQLEQAMSNLPLNQFLAEDDWDEAGHAVTRALQDDAWAANLEDVVRLLIALRSVSTHSEFVTSAKRRGSRAVYVACSLSPVVAEHRAVAAAWELQNDCRRDEAKRWTYGELAEHVLKRADGPLHWLEIANRARQLGVRDEIDERGIANVLSSRKSMFARVDAGTYGLVGAGYRAVRYLPDAISDALLSAGQPMTAAAIQHEVSKVRPGKQNSVGMLLDMDARFYQAENGLYGLRSWLAPREKQTIRTSPSHRESLHSFRRMDSPRSDRPVLRADLSGEFVDSPASS